jgi:ABC-type bacteriocin/lantibiotic exporter with double-glycine peptidase domain
MGNPIYITTKSSSLLSKVARILVTIVLIGLALMFSVLLFVVILTVGAMAWGYLWWRTRDLRKQMRAYPSDDVVIKGEVIEGEVIRSEVNRISEKPGDDESYKY